MTFTVLWPNGLRQQCYSPSLVVRDHLTVDDRYEIVDFVQRSRTALTEASDRVMAKFGFACTSAAATTEQISSAATQYPDDATIRVVAMHPGLEKTS
jgi:uncharacterized repeat protein (TIGR04042 family)